jgi:sirohydrochlorin cobaltochelatase
MTPMFRDVLLVGGHEGLPGEGLAVRDLHFLAARPGSAVVVPMTLGRDPELIEQTAQALKWAARERHAGELLLAGPLGTTTDLIGWLRAAACRAGSDAVLIVAPASSPEQDAELFKVARLVRQYSPVRWVEVALIGGDPDVAEGVARCHRLGARDVTVLPAAFVLPEPVEGARIGGPLLGGAALAGLVRQRASAAARRWSRHADDGIEAVPHDRHTREHG